MRVDFRNSPELAQRYAVVHVDGQEEIENVAWADDEKGEYGVYVMRPWTLADCKGVDRRRRDEIGQPKIVVHKGTIEIIDLRESPWKREAMLLLDDPDVQAKLRAIIVEAMDGVRVPR